MCALQDAYLYYFLLRHPGKTLIFVNAKTGISRLVNILSLLKMQVGIYSLSC